MEATNKLGYAYKKSADALEIYLYDDIEADKYDWWTGEIIKSDTSCKTIASLSALHCFNTQKIVDEIYYSLIPIAKAYFTRTRIEAIAQAVFDRIRSYADKYFKRIDK